MPGATRDLTTDGDGRASARVGGLGRSFHRESGSGGVGGRCVASAAGAAWRACAICLSSRSISSAHVRMIVSRSAAPCAWCAATAAERSDFMYETTRFE